MAVSPRQTKGRWLLVGISSLVFLLPPAWAESEGQWKSGEEVYAKVCGYCHQADIGIGPVIKGRNLPSEYTVHIVRHGLRAMPAFPAAFIDDEALREVADYISKSAAEQKQGAKNGR